MLTTTACALLASLLLIALFAASEAALAATNRVRLRHLLRAQNLTGEAPAASSDADSSDAEADAANSDAASDELSSEAQRFIATVTIAANIPVLAAASLSIFLAATLWGFSAVTTIASYVLAFFSIAILQVAPRLLVSRPGLKAPLWVRPARVLVLMLRPLVGVLLVLGTTILRPLGLLKAQRTTRQEREEGGGEEIRDLVEDLVESSHHASDTSESGKQLFESIFSFGDTRVHEVMIPRPDILALAQTSTPDAVLRAFEESGFSRVPVHEGDIDRIVGILHVNDVLKVLGQGEMEFSIRDLMRTPMFVPETMPIDEAFSAMRAARTHLAIVMDEFGGVAGLLTVEDILEELVGEIADEHDRQVEEPLVILDEQNAIADALLHIEDLDAQWNLKLPDGEFDTVGGFVIEQLGRAPALGDRIETSNAVLTVHALRGRRPHKIMVTKLNAADSTPREE